MFEFHGWINISQFSNKLDTKEFILIIKKIEEKTKKSMVNRNLTIENNQWRVFLICHSCTNRKGKNYEEVLEILNFIENNTKGSYGIVYIRDTEIIDIYESEFQVLVIRKGKIFKEKDIYLSPCIPMIEDE